MVNTTVPENNLFHWNYNFTTIGVVKNNPSGLTVIVKNALINDINILNVHNTVHMWSLLSMSARTPSVWLFRRKMKLVTSTIVGDIVMNSFLLLQHAEHAFTYSFSSTIDMCLPQGGHAFSLWLPYFLPYVLHVFASRPTHSLIYLNQ